MTILFRTVITAVGPDVADLLEGGVLILFADGAPPELAEVSALHRVEQGPASEPPGVGAKLTVGSLESTITGVGPLAWAKIADMGHVVINFGSDPGSIRPGEISASEVPADALAAAVREGAAIAISG